MALILGRRPSAGLLALLVTASFSADAPAQQLLRVHDGTMAGEHFSEALAFVGDLDADGVDDYAVGEPYATSSDSNPGRVYVYSGRSGTLLFQLAGERQINEFGLNVAPAGDVNGDGRADFIVAAPFYPDILAIQGRIYVYSGTDASLLDMVTGAVGNPLWLARGAGDVDGDGFDEILVSACNDSTRKSNGGRVDLRSGATKTTLWSKFGVTTNGMFGNALANLGDVDGDSIGDLVIAAPGAYPFIVPAKEEVLVFSGATGALIHRITAGSGDYFGLTLAAGLDADGDGVGDFAVGAPAGGTGDVGAIFLYSGQSGLLLGTREGEAGSALYGFGLSMSGDANGDGIPDLLVGSAKNSGRDAVRSRFEVVDARQLRRIARIAGPTDNEGFGRTVAGPVDLDGDGLGDLVAGASFSDVGGSDAGRVYVYKGDDLFATPNNVKLTTGETLEVDSGLGTPSQPALLALIQFGGINVWIPVQVGTFDSAGFLVHGGVVPPGLAGNVAVYQAFGLKPNGKLQRSATTSILFE